MLTLSRKEAESIAIGEDIVVTVVRIIGGKVKLGITAPKSVSIDRVEVRALKDAALGSDSL